MKLLPQFEDFVVKDKKLHFDPNAEPKNVSTKFGKGKSLKPYVASSGVDGVKIMSVYARVKDHDKTELNDILTSLKGKGPYELDEGGYQQFIKRTAIYINKQLAGEPIDLMLTIESKSSLARDLVKELKGMLSFDVVDISNAVQKNPNIDDISVSKDLKTTEGIEKYIEGLKAQASKNSYFKISDVGLSWLRQYIENWLMIPDSVKEKIKGKDVVLFDDYMTSGISMKYAIKLIKLADPKSIKAITILK